MILKGYGVELVRLRHEDIELVRQMRNSPEIMQRMEYREYITPEMQEEWFNRVDVPESHYYLVHFNGKKSGLINGAKIDWEKKETRSGGIFIWDEACRESYGSLGATLLMLDLTFKLGLERTYVKVLRDNPAAINFNAQLGYEMLPGQENAYNQEYVLTEEKYERATQKIKALLQRRFGPQLTVIADDPEHPATQFLVEQLLKMKPERREHFELIIPGKHE